MKKLFGRLAAVSVIAAALFASCSSENLLLTDSENAADNAGRSVSSDGLSIYVKSTSAPTIWVWENNGYAISEKMGYTWSTQPTMSAATDLNDNTDWYVFSISSSYLTSGNTKTINFILNKGNTVYTSKTATFWYDSGTYYDSDPTEPEEEYDDITIYVESSSAPTIWVWEDSGIACFEKMGYTWNTQPTMSAATGMNDCTDWYMFTVSGDYLSGSTIDFILNKGTTVYSKKSATFWYDSDGTITDADPTTENPDDPDDPDEDAVRIYVSATSTPTIWVWQPSGLACSEKMGYTWSTQPSMTAATELNWNDSWYYFDIDSDYYTSGKTFSFIINKGSTVTSSMTGSFWYDAAGVAGDAGVYYTADPTVAPDPVAPSVTLKPADGKTISTSATITVTFSTGYDDDNFEAYVDINGTTYTYGTDFTGTTLSKSVSTDLGITEDATITVEAYAVNSVDSVTASASYTVSTEVEEDAFTWDNALVYFVLTDRFNNGDSTNDHSYDRSNNSSNSSVPDVATFHGGDIKGLTEKLDYLDTLGVNAIWITAPYEQIHGWVSGKNQEFPHYAYHGYYTLDWTMMDKNMGTVDEFRSFVTEAHKRGIRVVMDVVMNHTGYNTVQDMITYNFGSFDGGTPSSGWIAETDSLWQANVSSSWTVKWGDGSSDGQGWENWWCSWVRAFDGLYGYQSAGGSDETMSLGGLPDLYTESSTAASIPTFLSTKWGVEGENGTSASDYEAWRVPAADGLRETVSGYSPHDYVEHWLAAWVREFGIDGFRVDTAKHVERVRWGELKTLCSEALNDWRADSSRVDEYAADWDEDFWMTGECFGWTSTAGEGEYYTTGLFDSMINFSFNGSSGNNSGSIPTVSTWQSYADAINANAKDSDSNGNHNNVLSYLSSHDTGLTRNSDQAYVGTMLELLPGGVQIFYGDETSRPSAYTSCCDSDMQTRGDMNWSSYDTSVYNHWAKVGTFRKFNPAVGAGTQTVSGTTYQRSYSGTAGTNCVAISLSSATADVSGLYSDGTVVYNWYTGESTTVSDGSAVFSSSVSEDAPLLVSDRNPSDYGVSF